MNKVKVLDKIDAVLTGVFKWICLVLFTAIMLIITASVLNRYVPIGSMNWMEEIVELCFAWMVFFGAAAVWITRGHFSAGDWIGKNLKNLRVRAAYRLLVELIAGAFIAVFFRYSVDLVDRALEITNILQFSKKITYISMPIASGVMVLYSVKFIVQGVIAVIKQPKAEEKPAREA